MRTFEDICKNYNQEVESLAQQLRTYLFSELPNIEEEIDKSQNMAFYSYGKGYKNLICMMSLSKQGLKLGFYKSSQFEDPNKVLTGKGKVHRHVEIKDLSPNTQETIQPLIQQALKAYKQRI